MRLRQSQRKQQAETAKVPLFIALLWIRSYLTILSASKLYVCRPVRRSAVISVTPWLRRTN